MKNQAVFAVCLGCFFGAATSQAVDLKQSKVTQVVNDVQIISAEDQKEKAASVNDIFSMPDILRTGAASRAELVAEDETVTRVGANTIFSFDPASRSIDLKQGSLLFHSPHGKGGGSIHTGSATASVLGTTLIVVYTQNGGLKVIALEGEVEVKFLNGLKQKLDPGEMTYVLPGANQLAPVIVFRLDELTQNSLLIKGFPQPLSSIGLIQNQIDRQLKLISSGKLGNTPFYAGDSATPTQIQVLDANTITGGQPPKEPPQPQVQTPPPSSPPPPPPPPPPVQNLSAAEGADATINQPSLTDASIPTPPLHVILDQAFPLTGINYFNGQTFSGFVAQNIYVNTPAAGLNPLVINMMPYTGLATFDFVSLNNFYFDGSVTFGGLSAAADLSLIAGNQFVLASGINLTANVHDFTLSSPTAMTFDNDGIYNSDSDINLNSGDSITFQNNSVVNANGRLIVNAANNITANDSQLTGVSALFSTLNKDISFEDTTLNAGDHALFESPTSISLDDSTINANSVALIASTSGTINVNNTIVNAPGSFTAVSINDLNITGSAPVESDAKSTHEVDGGGSQLNSDPTTGSVTLTSAGGSVNVSGTSITAHYLTINSGDGILLDGNGQTFTASGSGSTASFTAPNTITVNNANLSSFAVLNMAANTIVLANDILAAISNFGCQSGQANFSGAVVPGDVNFFNDTWKGQPVTSSTVTYSSGPGSATGIYVYPR